MSNALYEILTEAATICEAEFDNDEPINGADFLEWFASWRKDLKTQLELHRGQ